MAKLKSQAKAKGSVSKKTLAKTASSKKATLKKVAPKVAKPVVKKSKAAAIGKPKPMKSLTKVKTATSAQAASEKSLLGADAPAFAALSNGGKSLSSEDLSGKGYVLYFYPKDDTPGCTLEGQDFKRLYDKFKAAGVEVIGVSKDSVASHDKFCAKYNLSFPLLSDTDGKICEAFGVMKMKNMYGRTYLGIERSTFLVDRNGKVVREWRGVKVPGHAEQVLQEAKAL
jgi:peroxiredoxin Q/BCP